MRHRNCASWRFRAPAKRILGAADAWRRLAPDRICSYERMRVWQEGGSAEGRGAVCFDAADIGEPNLGYIVENSALQRACLESFRERGGHVVPGQLRELSIDAVSARLLLADGTALSARLVVGADGAQSAVRGLLRVPVQRRSFSQIGIVANLRTEKPHQFTAWQRFLHGGPLALLPLFDGSSSLVWSLEESRARTLLECGATQFSSQVEAAADSVLGAMSVVGARHGFPLQRLAAGIS